MIAGFREVVLADFEFVNIPGERPVPVCLVAHELVSGRKFRVWQNAFGSAPPYATGPDVLFVAYYASAELGCYRALGWQMPERILDLFTEFRNRTNGLRTPAGAKLIGALVYFGLDHLVGAVEKKELQEAIGSDTWQGRFSQSEILDYCETDVVALEQLLNSMISEIDLPRALLRGRSMAAAAAMEHNGVPIDTDMLARLRVGWDDIKDQLITETDVDYGVYEGRSFKIRKFEQWLECNGIPWPTLESGQLDLDKDCFREMANIYPAVRPLRELRSSLSEMRLNDLRVGRDGRNRTILSAFRARTSRYQPSNTRYIFGPSVWLRGLIKPPPGCGVAYVDWAQQEFGIAAALSGDAAMLEAYRSGDPYLAFAIQAGAAPTDATRDTHETERERFKQCILATQYGQGADGLAVRIGKPTIVARDLLRAHRQTYSTFWAWSDAAVDTAMLTSSLQTMFGWQVHVGADTNPRSLRNHPMQAGGAEMLRLACCLGTERGVEVCAPVHDAVLICAPLDRMDQDVAKMRAAMAEASRVVLGGFELGTDVRRTHAPDRYMDKRGKVMWDRVVRLLQHSEARRQEIA